MKRSIFHKVTRKHLSYDSSIIFVQIERCCCLKLCFLVYLVLIIEGQMQDLMNSFTHTRIYFLHWIHFKYSHPKHLLYNRKIRRVKSKRRHHIVLDTLASSQVFFSKTKSLSQHLPEFAFKRTTKDPSQHMWIVMTSS